MRTLLLVVALCGLSAGGFFYWINRPHRCGVSETTLNLRKLFDGSLAYWGDEHAAPDGSLLTPRFPPNAPLTPATTACKDGKPVKHEPTSEMWSHPAWRALRFSVDDPFWYQYQFVSDGEGFTARAIGDLDCDGVLSTFERVGRLIDGEIDGGPGILTKDELE
jgi:hypothetical protein